MKKLCLFIFISLLCMCLMASCTAGDTEPATEPMSNGTSASTDVVTEPQASDTAAETLELHEDLLWLFEEDENTYEDFTAADAEACTVHHPSYHVIPKEAIYYVIKEKGYSEDDVYAWLESFSDGKDDSATECCDVPSLMLFAEKYGITKNEMYDMHFLASHPEVDIEVLYSGDAKKIEEYFTNIEELNKIGIKKAHYDYMKDLTYESYRPTLEQRGVSAEEFYRMSYPEMIHYLAIFTNPQMLTIYRATEKCTEELGVCYTFDYKIELVNELSGGSNFMSNFSSNELDEMFCGLGRYKDVTVYFGDQNANDYSCSIHNWSYHILPPVLIEYIGGREALEGKFDLNTPVEGSCQLLSIKQVIDAFNISVDEFAEICPLVCYNSYYLEVLFNGTLEDADTFYNRDSTYSYYGSNDSLNSMWKLYDLIEENCGKGNTEIKHLSIPEIVILLEIDRDGLEKMIEQSTKHASYDYNLDMLYGTAGEIIFQKTDDISSNELNEMFCRVGRYAEKIPTE